MKDFIMVTIFIVGSVVLFGTIVNNYDKTSKGIMEYSKEVVKKSKYLR
jgi:hypothetical protein